MEVRVISFISLYFSMMLGIRFVVWGGGVTEYNNTKIIHFKNSPLSLYCYYWGFFSQPVHLLKIVFQSLQKAKW